MLATDSDQQQHMNGGQKKDERNGCEKYWREGNKCEKSQHSDTKENKQNAEKCLRHSRKLFIPAFFITKTESHL
ncbi:hypothetical protein AV530_014562 [Patagioenas fasciata monilis]|uniref:Uncharacterized protein n=1 Tax=Patagioenas fasciata monilis TaxID=372326 RepID=A0A1V4KCG9_PATFA|nr:hypothetical protein AV530_014562 [Patagioenas fasciata monilis]